MRLFLLLPILTLGACSATLPVSENAICDATHQSRVQHAQGLLEDGGPVSVATGATLLGQLEAAC